MSDETNSSGGGLPGRPRDGSPGTAAPMLGSRPSSFEQVWRDVETLGSLQVYPSGVELYRQDEQVQEVYWIEWGLIKLVRINRGGQEMIVDVWGGGQVLGLAAAILRLPVAVTAVTLTPCRLLRMPVEGIRRWIERLDEVSREIIQMVSREAYEQTLGRAAMGLLRARERVEWLLERLTCGLESAGRRKEIALPLPLRQWELAEMIGIRPEHLSRLLRQMEREGLVRRHKGRVVIIDRGRLRKGP